MTYTIGERSVSREEFFAQARGLVMLLPLAILLALVAFWGLLRERPWGRHAVFGLFGWDLVGPVVAALGDPTARAMVPVQLGFAVLFLAPLGWYLYRRLAVVAYYQALHARRRGDAGRMAPAI